jgi:hypothetical protein
MIEIHGDSAEDAVVDRLSECGADGDDEIMWQLALVSIWQLRKRAGQCLAVT